MKFIADFHVHSKFSRATAKNLDLENLYIAAQLKGINLLGTGDFTHPGWFLEIKKKLVPAEEGLFKLKNEFSKECDKQVPDSCRGKVRFLLTSEISNIYKKNKKTRKNHNLVFVPDIDIAEKFSSKLDKIGNIKSDGRPILGLDTKNLLEILLETSEQALFVPAHIWTPWFSLFGSKSGFDSIEECFEDLTHHIFAVETGLSSDPGMNRRVSDLDDLTLLSNSDAHSPLNLGREANLFDTELTYSSIKTAIKTGDSNLFKGTLEFYPEEGKYHLDGHRKCNIRLWPKETRDHGGICPVCEKPLTLGVLHRIEELSDRPEDEKPEKTIPYYSLIPLSDILSEILRVGPKTKKVKENAFNAIKTLGPEFSILHSLKTDEIDRVGIPLLGEAIQRMRRGKISIFPGYDGEFGKVKIFKEQEREILLGQKSLFVLPISEKGKIDDYTYKEPLKDYSVKNYKKELLQQEQKNSVCQKLNSSETKRQESIVSDLNKEQKIAVHHESGPMLIVAGPGTGKTRTITYRIGYLIKKKNVSPKKILAITFTNKAAQEMRDRLELLLGSIHHLPFVTTFHAFCFKILKEQEVKKKGFISKIVIEDNERTKIVLDAAKQVEQNGKQVYKKPRDILDMIISAKQKMLEPHDNLEAVVDKSETNNFSDIYRSYQNLLSIQGLYDYEDLIFKVVRRFETDKKYLKKYQKKFQFIFVDEYQDINYGQYRIIRELAPPAGDLCVIGDPDQSIYGFRGSDVQFFNRFLIDYPRARTITLSRNYRSTETILEASHQVIKNQKNKSFKSRIYSKIDGEKRVDVIELETAKAEAVAVGKIIEQMIGGMGFHSIDFGKTNGYSRGSFGFSDFAVLYRTGNQSEIIADVFKNAGIPYQIANREHIFNNKFVSNLLSLLKIIDGYGSYFDLERIINCIKPKVSKKTVELFKTWCFRNSFTLKTGMGNVRRFPIKGVDGMRQRNLLAFIEDLSNLSKSAKEMTLHKKLLYILENSKFVLKIEDSERKDILNNIIGITKTFGNNTSKFLTSVALQTDTDIYDSQAEKVTLMTMHAAKGLEFPIIFITGCENGYLPFEKSDKGRNDINEERRLFYVAMTRAKKRLYLTYAKKRRIYGKLVLREISPFVNDIENRLKKQEIQIVEKKKKENQVQLKLF